MRIELVAQQAEKDGLTKDADIATRLELSRLNLLQQAAAQKYLQGTSQPTEAELRAEFETQLASMPLVEYHARHILVSGQDVAQKVIDQLNGGTDFDDLAKRLSDRQELRRARRRPRLVPAECHAAVIRRCGGAAQEGRVHQDARADRRTAGM